eukprot:638202-Pleurochrysis_carterae.AAC.1
MSSGGSPARVRLRAARRRSRLKPSSLRPLPLSSGSPPPSATHARRARSTMPKSADGARAAPPAMTCAMHSSSARRPRPLRMSAGAVSPVTAPTDTLLSLLSRCRPAGDRAGSGAWPPSSLTTGPSSKSAASTLSTNLSISPATAV